MILGPSYPPALEPVFDRDSETHKKICPLQRSTGSRVQSPAFDSSSAESGVAAVIHKATCNSNLSLVTGSTWSISSEHQICIAPDGAMEPFPSLPGWRGSGRSTRLRPRKSPCVFQLHHGRELSDLGNIFKSVWVLEKNEDNNIYSSCRTRHIRTFIYNYL